MAVFLLFALTLFIGLRHEVGGDWSNYLGYIARAKYLSYIELLAFTDPAFNLLNRLFADTAFGIYGVNTVCALIFSAGLLVFCRAQPRPFLALSVSIPYLVIVVAMGYTRQSVSIGIMMLGLVLLESSRIRSYLALVALASSFHSSALISTIFALPLLQGRSRFSAAFRILLISVSAISFFYIFLSSQLSTLVINYIESEYQSDGAFIRVFMNLVPAILLLAFPHNFYLTTNQARIWRTMSLLVVSTAVLLLAFPANSTAIDRISLYFIPLQLFVFSRLPSSGILGLSPRQLLSVLLVYVFTVQFTWLVFATHSSSWIPYQSYLFL